MHCEEFDDLTATELKKKPRKSRLKTGAGDKRDGLENLPRARGLCINCDDAEICKLAGFGGEVVFCEEHSSNFDNAGKDKAHPSIFTNMPDLGVKNLVPGWDT